MAIPDLLRGLFLDYTLRTVALGSAILGATAGALGGFAVLRRQSLIGDAMSHAALPGIALAFLVTRTRHPIVLLAGAFVAAWVGMLWVTAITRTTRVKPDTALGIVLAVFFGLGLVLLTVVQKLPDANQAGLDKFLFGQAATLLTRDVVTIAALGAAAVLGLALFWKEFKLLSFDPEYAATLGFPIRALETVLTTLLVVAIVIGLQTVGVVLMSSLVVAPAAAARQWTDRLGRMVALSALMGAAAGAIGALISATGMHLPTGPLIVLSATAFVLVSVLFAPNRGLVAEWFRRRRSRRVLHLDSVLVDLYALMLQHPAGDHAHGLESIRAMRPSRRGVERSLEALAGRGWARRDGDGWVLTAAGIEEARARRLGAEGGETA